MVQAFALFCMWMRVTRDEGGQRREEGGKDVSLEDYKIN